jgi:hypothetical protein
MQGLKKKSPFFNRHGMSFITGTPRLFAHPQPFLIICLSALFAFGASTPWANPAPKKKTHSPQQKSTAVKSHPQVDHEFFRAYGRELGRAAYLEGLKKDQTPPDRSPVFDHLEKFESIADHSIETAVASFRRGRFNRSSARLPENIEKWRSEPDIDNPGADLANWPNSAFTLPQGRSYVEVSPFGYYGSSKVSPQQFDMQYLLRYGVLDDVELRIFGNGFTYTGGNINRWDSAPLGFDTKIQLRTEQPDSILPAIGFEAYVMTQWLGNTVTNGGTQPGFSFNFDQSLPYEIDFEYNVGAFRSLTTPGKSEWNYNFQWAFQKSFFNPSFSLFIHGYINGATIPKSPTKYSNSVTNSGITSVNDNIIGGGFIWSLSRRLSVWGQASTGTTSADSGLLTYSGFAVAF